MPKLIAIIIESVLFVCILWVLAFLSTLLHEAGHALGYRIATGDRHWHIRVGWGKRLLNTRQLTVNLLPFDGFFTPLEKDKIDTTARLITILAGGPAVSFLLVVGLLLLKFGGLTFHSDVFTAGAVESFISIALFINLAVLLMSLIPTHYFYGESKGVETDGLQILHAIRDRKKQNTGQER